MKLLRATIKGYRSIKDSMEFVLDERVTVVLGANDHGKSNLLQALLHINEDAPFVEEDVNWDCEGEVATLPSALYEFALSDEEKEKLRAADAAHESLAALSEHLQSLGTQLTRANAASQEADKAVAAAETTAAEAEQESDEETAEQRRARVAERTKARQDLAAAMKRQEESRRRAEEIRLRIDVARARQVEVAGSLQGISPAAAMREALKEANTAASSASEQSAAAKRRADAAASAGEAAGATDDESERLAREADAATRQAAQAAKSLDRARKHAADLKKAADGLKALDKHPKPKDIEPPLATPKPIESVPSLLVVEREGIKNERTLRTDQPINPDALEAIAGTELPRVEIIAPFDRIPDAVTRRDLDQDGDFSFMRGIFHYAELDPASWDRVFAYSDTTTRQLEDASDRLNKTLKASWSQGKSLRFRLDHNSAKKTVELQIKDPAVLNRFVRASRRSSGFTHFFALKTILYAHQKESPANSYLWLFDEPGIYLHPDGQYDLIQVMETLAQNNQVVYTTHSIFMANKNYPIRHRLLYKGESGTQLDGKPFRSRWKPALDALGLSLTGTLLFASRVLLVEGDSDAIYLNAILHRLLRDGEFAHDVNPLAVLSTGDAQDAAAMIRILQESAAAPSLAILVDGDDGGKKRAEALEELANDRKIPIIPLKPEETTIEDHLLGEPSLYVSSVAQYLAKISTDHDAAYYEGELGKTLSTALDSKGLPKGLASWSRDEAKRIAKLESKPSATGIAREYADLLDAADPATLEGEAGKRGRELAALVAKTMSLPPLILEDTAILASPGE